MRRLPPKLLSGFVGFFVFIVSLTVWSADFVISRAILEDPSSTLTIDDVIDADFQPMGELLSKGYTKSVHWIRIRVKATSAPSSLELRIRPTFLDEVKLYEADPLHAGRWIMRVTGDKQPYVQRDRKAVTLGFLVSMPAQEATYYLRLNTTSSSLLNVEALKPEEARVKDVRLDMFQALYLGFMLWLLFWAANDYVLNRQRVVALFLICQVVYSLYALAVMGYFALLLHNQLAAYVDKITSVLVCLATAASLIFHRSLLSLFSPPRITLHILDALVLSGFVVLIMLLFGYSRQSLQLNAFVILLAAPVFVGLAFLSRLNVSPGLVVIRVIYSLQAISLLISVLPLLGFVSATEWNLQATLIHGLISASLMFLLLHIRSRDLGLQARQAKLDMELMHQKLMIEQVQRQQQERFVAMLTHELKTPISVIGLELATIQSTASAKDRSLEALNDLNAIVEHCQQVDQLERQQVMMRLSPCRIEELLDELVVASGGAQRFLINAKALPVVSTDRQLLRVTLNNLIGNALKYAAKESVINIRALLHQQSGKSGVLVVVANQPGVAGLPDAEKVFNKYYRSPGAHRKTGSGLGLYLVKSYMDLLGGEVFYQLTDNHVEFSIWLPC